MGEHTRAAVGRGTGGQTPRRTVRRRDRRGRGLRGPLLPASLPGAISRSDRFDEFVLDAVERLERRWAGELDRVEFAVEDIPPSDPSPWEQSRVPLGRFFGAQGRSPARIVMYRRPIETRATDADGVERLIGAVVVEQVAHLLGVDPRTVDPGYEGLGDD